MFFSHDMFRQNRNVLMSTSDYDDLKIPWRDLRLLEMLSNELKPQWQSKNTESGLISTFIYISNPDSDF